MGLSDCFSDNAMGKEVVVDRTLPTAIKIPSPQFSPTDSSPYSNLGQNRYIQVQATVRAPSPQFPFASVGKIPLVSPSTTPPPPNTAPRSFQPPRAPTPSTPPRPNSRSSYSRGRNDNSRTSSPSRLTPRGQTPSINSQHYQTLQHGFQTNSGYPGGNSQNTLFPAAVGVNQTRNINGRHQRPPSFVDRMFLPRETVGVGEVRPYLEGGEAVDMDPVQSTYYH